MARGVILVDADLDALGELASRLRARGVTVWLADGLAGALERLHNSRPDAVLLAASLCDDKALPPFLADRHVTELPVFVVATAAQRVPETMRRLPRDDADLIAKTLHALQAVPRVAADRGDVRGDLQQVAVADLLQLLGMNRRTGVLTITTPSGLGEVRLTDGEIVDAVYRRLEGEKALYRLFGENDGTFSFAGGAASPLRRVQTSSGVLLMEGMRRLDEARERRSKLAAGDDALLMVALPPPDSSPIERRVSEALVAPHTLDELLDELPEGDVELLEGLERLLGRGEVRRIPRGAVRHELADPEQMTVLGAVVRRLQKPGYLGPTRIVLAASPKRLATVAHAVRRIADAVAPAEPAPAAPVPYLLATLRVAEGAELDVVGLPALAAFSPLWALALPGSAAVVRLDNSDQQAVADAASMAEVPLLDAAVLIGTVDEADPAQIAALIRTALDNVAAS